MKTARGFLAAAAVFGLLSWGSHTVLFPALGWWSWIPTVLLGVVALCLLFTAAVTVIIVSPDRLTPENSPRALRLVAPYAMPALMVVFLVIFPFEFVYRARHLHGAGQVFGLIESCFLFLVVGALFRQELRSKRRGDKDRGPDSGPDPGRASAEVASAEAEEPEGE